MEKENVPMVERVAASDGDAACGAAGTMGRLDMRAAGSNTQRQIRAAFKQKPKEKSKDLPRDCQRDGGAMGGEV